MKAETLVLVTALGAAGLAASCVDTRTNLDPTHCNSNDGDAFCAREHPDGDLPYCRLGTMACDEAGGITDLDADGCVAARPEDECWSACGGGVSIVDDPTCEGVADTTMTGTTGTETMSSDTPPTSSSMTGDPSTESMTETSPTESDTTDGGGCTGDDDCMDADSPFCDPAGTCVACDGMPDGDAACAGADPGLPVCEGGACVQCTEGNAAACEGQTPICGEENACRGCTEHSECPDSACHLDGDEVGACFEDTDVEMVANAAALDNALSGLGATDNVVIILASGTYLTTASISGGAEVAILGPASAVLDGGGGFGVNVAAGSYAYLSGISVSDGSDTGVRCIGSSVWLDDMEVSGNPQVGLEVSSGCSAHLRRAVVAINNGGGIDMTGGELHMANSVAGLNGGVASPFGGISLDGVDVFVTYSTIAGNDASNSGMSIRCLGTNSGFVRNTIIVGADANSVDACAGVTFETNAVDDSGLGGTNDNVGAFDLSWFANPTMGNYHLNPGAEGTFMDIAEWQDGDPLTDVDGEPIPTAMPSFPGYDQP